MSFILALLTVVDVGNDGHVADVGAQTHHTADLIYREVHHVCEVDGTKENLRAVEEEEEEEEIVRKVRVP